MNKGEFKVAETEIQAPLFDFSGNHLCLDFTNTVQDRPTNPRELFNGYNDLLRWSKQALLLTDNEAQRLHEEAEGRKAEAGAVLQRAVNLREAIYQVFFAVAIGSTPEKADLDLLSTEFSKAMSRACIVPTKDTFVLDWFNKEDALDRILWPVVRSASDLLTSEALGDVRVCASEDCRWLFLDTSKNHSRRWCDMKSCGNRAKARRHYNQRRTSVADK